MKSETVVVGLICFVTGLIVGMLVRRKATIRGEETETGRKGRGGVEIYVGNLPYEVDEKELVVLFQPFGRVNSARIIQHRGDGRSKGYGFVEMGDAKAARAAIKAMNGQEFKGRKLVVNEARSRSRGDEGEEA